MTIKHKGNIVSSETDITAESGDPRITSFCLMPNMRNDILDTVEIRTNHGVKRVQGPGINSHPICIRNEVTWSPSGGMEREG